jgi:hypothetical protein
LHRLSILLRQFPRLPTDRPRLPNPTAIREKETEGKTVTQETIPTTETMTKTDKLTPETLRALMGRVLNALARGDEGSLAEARYALRDMPDGGLAHADAWQARVEEKEKLLDEVNARLAVLEPALDRISANTDEIIRQRDASQARVEALALVVTRSAGEAAHIAGLAETLTDKVLKAEIARRADALTKRLEAALAAGEVKP